jgi:tetratricopeptide (TPR) repeat protein
MESEAVSISSIVGERANLRGKRTGPALSLIYALLFAGIGVLFCTVSSVTGAQLPAYPLVTTFIFTPTLTAEAYNNRGVASRALGDYEEALADFNRAIELDPYFAGAYDNRGITYYLMGENDLSLADFNRAIELNPDYSMTYGNRGELYYRRFHDNERALADFNQAIALDPENALAYNNRGNLYIDADYAQYEDAIQDYTRAIALQPDYYEAYANRATAYLRLGDLERGYADASQSIKLNPEFARAYALRGAVEMTRGNNAAALDDFREFIRFASEDESPDTINRVNELIRALEAEQRPTEVSISHKS